MKIPEIVSAVLSALTLLVAFLAIFGRWVRSLFFKPKFSLFLRNRPPYCLQYPLLVPETGARTGLLQINVRLRVKNSGNLEARQVEVYAEKLTRLNAAGVAEWLRTFTPMNLNWSDISMPKAIYFRRISPRMSKFCNLGFAFPSNDGVKFTFATILEPSHGYNTVGPGTYRLDVIVAAANAEPKSATIEIDLAGEWHPEEDRMHDVVRVRLVNL